jgi:hypothetical protein
MKHNTWDAMSDSKTRPLRLTDEMQPKLLENVRSTTVPTGGLSNNPDCKAASFHTHCRWHPCCCLQRHYWTRCQSPQCLGLGWLSASLAATGVPLLVPCFASRCRCREKKPVYRTRMKLVAPPAMALGGLLARWQAPGVVLGFVHLHLHHLPKANELILGSVNKAWDGSIQAII